MYAMSQRTHEPIRFSRENGTLFGWYHPPKAEASRGVGIVLCNTVGKESIGVAPRTLLLLAERLANAGFAVLRFDFYGTGDSSGDSTGVDGNSDRFTAWLDNIDLAIEELRSQSGVKKVGLMGLRLGATLAMVAAARRDDIDSLVIWHPYYTGKSYVTETLRFHKAFESLADGYFKHRPDEIHGREALGFFLSHATIAQLEKVQLPAIEKCPARHVLVISPTISQNRGGTAFLDRLRGLGVEPDFQVLTDRLSENIQMLDASDREVIVNDIASWATTKIPADEEHKKSERVIAKKSLTAASTYTGAGFREEPIVFGENGLLFGVLTTPTHENPPADRPVIITVINRMGPHRLFVRLARDWAKLGFAVFRVDLTGSGDSIVPGEKEADPYPRRAMSDLREAMAFLHTRMSATRFMVTGICTGADIAFQAGIHDPRVVGSILLNPRSFALVDIPTLEVLVRAHRVQSDMVSAKNWKKLFSKAVTFKEVTTKAAQLSAAAILKIGQKLKIVPKPSEEIGPEIFDVPSGVRQLSARGAETILILREFDAGITYFDLRFGKKMTALEQVKGYQRILLKDVDHLFTSLFAQDLLAKTTIDYLKKNHLEKTRPVLAEVKV
jgi:dienelactone hydrolase